MLFMASLKPRNSSGKILLDRLSKETFLENIIDSRKSQGVPQNFSFDKGRCRVLSKNEHIKENSTGIVYWMLRDCRVQDNWAMVFAQRLAAKQSLPLHVCYVCKDSENRYPTKRHFRFFVDGMKLVKKDCAELNIGFHMLNCTPKELAQMIIKNNIGGVVCDFTPLKYPKQLQETFLKELSLDIPVVQVDAHNIVPAWVVSNKQEGMAKFLRPKINKNLPEYLTGFPDIAKHAYSGKFVALNEIDDIEDTFEHFKPKWDLHEVTWGEGPGEKAGLSGLFSFIKDNLKFYGVSSNDPSKEHTSKLSPWLNFGQMSAQRVALEVKSIESAFKDQCDKYLEELIVRRELTDNYCFYNINYDNINGAANWAKETLKTHAKDKRTWIYTRDQLERAETHDECWNAAQMQAFQEGKIHGYMRMYWCKKILEWTESPEQAIEYALWLNDTFCLDGTDPNGYVGVLWSICGVHDQGWKERDVFGKIRYMVDYSLKRKFDMEAYCARYGRKADKVKEEKKKNLKRKHAK